MPAAPSVDLPLIHGPGHYIVSESGDAYATREVGVVADGAGRMPAGMVMSKVTVTVSGQPVARYRPWAAGDTNAVILYEGIDARVRGAKRTFTVRTAEVQRAKLAFAGTPTDEQKNTAYGQLAVNHVTLR